MATKRRQVLSDNVFRPESERPINYPQEFCGRMLSCVTGCCPSGWSHRAAPPNLNRLKREPDQHEANTKNSHASFGHMIGPPFDKGGQGPNQSGNDANGQSGLQSDGDRVFPLLRD